MTRHELKEQLQHDQFTDSVSHALTYASSHKQRLIQWGIAAGIAIIVVVAVVWFNSYRRAQRQHDLQTALTVVDAQVGPPNEYVKTFATQDEKLKASMKAMSEVAAKDAGTNEGFFAQYYLGTLKAQKNDFAGAEADLLAVSKSHSASAALAKIALAQLYMQSNKSAQAQDLLKALINKPTDLVSKAQAQLLLAQLVQGTNPQEAKQILQQLKASNNDPAVGRAADQLSAQLAK